MCLSADDALQSSGHDKALNLSETKTNTPTEYRSNLFHMLILNSSQNNILRKLCIFLRNVFVTNKFNNFLEIIS